MKMCLRKSRGICANIADMYVTFQIIGNGYAKIFDINSLRFRLSSHKYVIETGLYIELDRDNRF